MDPVLMATQYLATISRDDEGTYRCSFCGFVALSEPAMMSHLESDHANSVSAFQTSEQYTLYCKAQAKASQAHQKAADAELYYLRSINAFEAVKNDLPADVQRCAIRISRNCTTVHKNFAVKHAELSKKYAADAVAADASTAIMAARLSEEHALECEAATEFARVEAEQTEELAYDDPPPQWLSRVSGFSTDI